MSANPKCPSCNLCLDLVYTPELVQYWHCWLCQGWFQNNCDNILSKVENPLQKEEPNGTTSE